MDEFVGSFRSFGAVTLALYEYMQTSQSFTYGFEYFYNSFCELILHLLLLYFEIDNLECDSLSLQL